MSARHDTCPTTAVISGAMALEDLSEKTLAHAEGCDTCGALLARQRELAVLTARVRRAHDQAGDLDPAAWARIRMAIDSRPSTPPWRSWLFGLAAVGLGAAVVLWATATPDSVPGEDHQIAREAKPTERVELAEKPEPTPGPEKPIDRPPVERTAVAPALEVATASGDLPVPVGPGSIIAAASDGERYRLIGRHTMELSQGARLRVRTLETAGVELDLLEGLASFDVYRAADERLFRVHVGDVLVEVRGTFWSVERRPNGVVVSVERGRVAVMREGEEEVMVEAGERVVFPRLDLPPEVEPAPPTAALRSKRPKPEKMIEVEVGHSSARAPSAPAADVEHLIPPILGAVRAGRCVQALSALDHVSRAVEGRLPRSAIWLTAYCQRKLGNLDNSRKLFARYGAGPWAIPTGDELPPLP